MSTRSLRRCAGPLEQAVCALLISASFSPCLQVFFDIEIDGKPAGEPEGHGEKRARWRAQKPKMLQQKARSNP